MPSLCPTCQLYVPSSGRCVEYDLVPSRVEHCPKYIEDCFVTRRMKAMNHQGVKQDTVKVPATQQTVAPAPKKRFPSKIPPEAETKIIELTKQGHRPMQIAALLGLGSTSAVYRVLREHGLHKKKNINRSAITNSESRAALVSAWGDCSNCIHALVCAIKDKAQANRDWAICRHWMAKAQAQKGA